jgi:hemerythrin-like domain-containing protein
VTLEALQVLREEHRWIVLLLDGLEETVQRARRSARLEGELAAELLALFVHFADGLHQRREEACLFPRLLARARSVEERLAIGRLCGDHERERHSLRELSERLLGAIYGAPQDLHGFLREAELFVAMHRQHVHEENLQLLPLSEARLTAEDDALLLAAYRELERGGPERGHIGQRILTLCGRLGIGVASNER